MLCNLLLKIDLTVRNWKSPKPHFISNGKLKGCRVFVHTATLYYWYIILITLMHTVNSKLHLETQMFQHVLDQKNLVSLMYNVSELEKDISNTYFTSKWHWSMQVDFVCMSRSKKPSVLFIVLYITIKDKILLAFPFFYKQDLFKILRCTCYSTFTPLIYLGFLV